MLYMFTRVFGNFHLIYGDYFVISSSIPSNLSMLTKMSSQIGLHPSSQIRSTKQPSSPQIHPLNSKSSQISSTKQTLRVLLKKFNFNGIFYHLNVIILFILLSNFCSCILHQPFNFSCIY